MRKAPDQLFYQLNTISVSTHLLPQSILKFLIHKIMRYEMMFALKFGLTWDATRVKCFRMYYCLYPLYPLSFFLSCKLEDVSLRKDKTQLALNLDLTLRNLAAECHCSEVLMTLSLCLCTPPGRMADISTKITEKLSDCVGSGLSSTGTVPCLRDK